MAREGYIELNVPADADPDALRERFVASLQEAIPGWEPADGDIVVRIGDGTGEMAADREAMVIDVSRELFRVIGAELFAVMPLEARPATGLTNWTFRDAVEHTIPAGTQITVAGIGFETTSDTTGTSPVTGVEVAALIDGEAGNGVSGNADVLDAEVLLFTSAVTMPSPTTSGRDDEPQDTYEDRLSARIAHLGRPVLPADFADRARDTAGVFRALAIDLYKPGPPWHPDPAATAAERTVTVVPVDEAGADLPESVRITLDAALQAERETNFAVFVINPTRTVINVAATITVWDGYVAADVLAAAEAGVAEHLHPGRWGLPPFGDQPEWHDTPLVDVGAVEAAILATPGVRRVVTITVNGGTADVNLPGPAPLPTPGTIAVTEAP